VGAAVSKKPKGGHGERFVQLFHSMLKLPVWKTMSPAAKALLLEVLQRHNGSNNGEISYSVREAQEAGVMTKNTAARAFRELQERGFLRVGRPSCFSLKTATGLGINRCGTRATEWRITWLKGANGESPSRDYLDWQPAAHPRRNTEKKRSAKLYEFPRS
jgi:hypothetical protein